MFSELLELPYPDAILAGYQAGYSNANRKKVSYLANKPWSL